MFFASALYIMFVVSAFKLEPTTFQSKPRLRTQNKKFFFAELEIELELKQILFLNSNLNSNTLFEFIKKKFRD